jgi:hypothetical protein
MYLANLGVNNFRYGGAEGFAKCWVDNPDWQARQEELGRSITWMTENLPDTYHNNPRVPWFQQVTFHSITSLNSLHTTVDRHRYIIAL